MDAILQARFERIETALTTLVDSIAAYNPSHQAAVDIIAANDHLAKGLDQLAQHGENYARIQSLRNETDALEDQLKSSVATLADLRRELFATPATTFPEDARPVPFDELLQYAKNIAKFTVPPTYREPVPEAQPDPENKDPEDGAVSALPSTGAATPAQPAAQEATQATEAGSKENEEQVITAEEAEWLKKLKESKYPWSPWPDNDKIRGGNLMQIQYALDTGKDPANEDLTTLAEEEKDRIAEEAKKAAAHAQLEAEAQAPAQTQQQAQAEAHAAQQRQEAAQSRPAPKPQKTFAGFDFADDSDED